MMTNREVDWVFGLLVGMMHSEHVALGFRAEGAPMSNTPAGDWYRQYQNDPIIRKARLIYEQERRKASKKMLKCRHPR